jgi:hypothetical protein
LNVDNTYGGVRWARSRIGHIKPEAMDFLQAIPRAIFTTDTPRELLDLLVPFSEEVVAEFRAFDPRKLQQ